MSKIKVLMADDHGVLRAGVKALINAQPDMEVIAEAIDGEQAVRRTRETSPDVVLMDIAMPGLNGLEATRLIKRENQHVKIIALTMHDDHSFLYQMLRAGANGYVPKKAADTELIEAIRATCRGEHFIHSSLTTAMVTAIREKEKTTDTVATTRKELSERELEVLKFLASGYSNQQIANMLCVSVKTIETHKARITAKLDIKGRAEILRYAISIGIFDPSA